MSETTPTGDSIDQIRRQAEACWLCSAERRQRGPRALCPAHARRLRVVEEAEKRAGETTTERPALPTAAEVREVAGQVGEWAKAAGRRTHDVPHVNAPAWARNTRAAMNRLQQARAALVDAAVYLEAADEQQTSTD